MAARLASHALRRERLLVAGVSTRAAAESAAHAGFAVTALDAFGDLDQDPRVASHSLPRDFGTPFTATAAARAASTIACEAVAYLSSFENHPRAVATLAARRALWGNPPAVLRRVRDPWLVADVLSRRGLATPAVFPGARSAGPQFRSPKTGPRAWLLKPLNSGGGHRVRPWRGGPRIPRGCYLQELIGGTPGSVIFVAAGGRAVLLGVSRQLTGEAAFGAAGYRYCGSILTGSGDGHETALLGPASRLANAIAEEFGLVGVNGIDFVASGAVPYAIEVNPRWSASMELVERASGFSMFGAHAVACAAGSLPEFDLSSVRSTGAVGKAVVFARRDVRVGDSRTWLDDESVRDVPRPGERITAGRPVCTVFAVGDDAPACHAALVRRAERVYVELAEWEQRVA